MAFSLKAQDVAWIDRAPIHVEQDTVVEAGVDEVFATLADHERWPSWYPGMRKVEVTGAASGVGATRAVWLGPIRADERFVVWEPGARLSFLVTAASTPGLVSMVEDLQLEALADERTRVRYRIGIEGPGALRFVVPVLRAGADRAVAGGLKGLAASFR